MKRDLKEVVNLLRLDSGPVAYRSKYISSLIFSIGSKFLKIGRLENCSIQV